MEQNQRPDHELTPQQSTPDEQRTPPASTPSKRFSQFFKHTPRITSATALLLIALALVFYLIGNLTAFSTFFGKVMGLFKPLLWGALIAYFCNPILRFWERRVLFKVSSFHIRRMLGIILTYFSIILAVSVFGLILLPSLISSFKELLSNFQNYIANAVTYINNLLKPLMEHFPMESPDAEELISAENIITAAQALISKAGNLFDLLVNYLGTYASQLISGVTDIILAVFISFYLLSSKELRLAQTRKVITAFCSEKVSKFTFETVSMIHNTFGRYFQGVIVDAIIIFFAGLIVFSIMDIHLALMIAFIVAITNVIPVFGPFLGAIPSAFIIFITQPEKTIPFVLAVLIMQQIDGNIIAPKILGESTGISSLCVIVSLAIMGNIFGVFGMVIAVPVFAVLVMLLRQAAEAKLAKKELSVDVDDYYVDEPQPSEEHPHKSGIMHSITKRVRRAFTYALSYTKYGCALAVYHIKKKKNHKLKPPAKQDYLPLNEKSKAPATRDSAVDAAAKEETDHESV